MRHFYPQTIEMTPVERQEAEHRAMSQEERIYAFMKVWGFEYSAWDLKRTFPEFEITSIRRALFNLEKQGRVARYGWVKGPKGVKVGTFLAWSGKLF